MIEANELRIGNTVTERNGIEMIVRDITPYKCTLQVGEDCLADWDEDLENIHPIPLTSELLERWCIKDGFGHHIDITPRYYQHGWRRLVFTGDYLFMEEWDGKQELQDRAVITLWNKDVMKVFHLHQLQNLFYSLTHTELKPTSNDTRTD